MANTPNANPGTVMQQVRVRPDPGADYWTRQYGVPWDQLSRAVKAVNARASRIKPAVPPRPASDRAAGGQH
jgi:hypothetical protein